MTLYWHQAKEVAETARRTNRVFQCGAQSANAERWRVAQRIIKNGGIGPTVWVEGGAFRNDPRGDWNWYIDPSANPSNLDWDMWLGWKWGLAPKRPWEPERYFRFRKFWDYSGGLATDLLYHTLSHLLIALGPKFPRRVVAAGGNVVFNLQNDNREVPENFHVLIEYPDNSVVILEATQVCNYGVPEIIRGQHATMHFEAPGIVIRPQSPFVEQVTEKAEKGIYDVEGVRNLELVRDSKDRVREIKIHCHTSGDQGEHVANWLECIRTRNKPNLDADTAYKVMVPIALSVESYRQQKAKLFDPEREEVIQ
ncbi:MAG TPA: hypothetical protein EYP10_06290 [Armatimonadetes bacterium]|nr:hypothetical protein [Armatimonadota bacterium]